MLELKEISFTVKGVKSPIINRLSLRIPNSSLIAITGPNGSGKSTLAEIIMGIKKPATGQIILEGQDITNEDITARARLGLAYSFQQPVKFKGLTVYDLINIANGELTSEEDASKFLAQVGLDSSGYLQREVNSKLSGGELKRIEIATILARRNAKYIIFDEPEAGIDLWSFASLIKIFQKLRKSDKTLIIITHQERILQIADEIIILEDSQIKSHGTPDKIIPSLRESKL